VSSWETRELPLLRAIDAQLQTKRPRRRLFGVTLRDLTAETGWSEEDVQRSLRVLAEAHGPYVTGRSLLKASGRPVVTGLTDRARAELDKRDRDIYPPGPGAAPG
jgi:hypothetical protein